MLWKYLYFICWHITEQPANEVITEDCIIVTIHPVHWGLHRRPPVHRWYIRTDGHQCIDGIFRCFSLTLSVCLDKYSIKKCSWGQTAIIQFGPCNDLALKQGKNITWTNDDHVHWCLYASTSTNELRNKVTQSKIISLQAVSHGKIDSLSSGKPIYRLQSRMHDWQIKVIKA